MISVEEIDLFALARLLRERFGDTLDEGYLDGRTVLRDAIAAHLRCSDLEAEELVDTMEANGYLHFPQLEDSTHSRRVSIWTILDHL
jgi:hypothetical protein